MKKKRKITVASAKAKARRLQQFVAERLSIVTGLPSGKDECIESREMGQSGPDVKLIGEAREMLKIAVECKAQENWSVHGWIEQSIYNQRDDEDWILVCKRNRRKPVVIISWEYYEKLLQLMVAEREELKKLNELLTNFHN